jgi:hypothetical protein
MAGQCGSQPEISPEPNNLTRQPVSVQLQKSVTISLMSLQATEKCTNCNSRSDWDFLASFIRRADEAEARAIRCEAFTREAWSLLADEQLEHRATKQALLFERDRHEETEAAVVSACDFADFLYGRSSSEAEKGRRLASELHMAHAELLHLSRSQLDLGKQLERTQDELTRLTSLSPSNRWFPGQQERQQG